MKLAKVLWIVCAVAAGCGDLPADEDQDTLAVTPGPWPVWKGPVSEEQPDGVICAGNAVIGAHCTGSYCDNISIQCAYIQYIRNGWPYGVTTQPYGWMPWISEEKWPKTPYDHNGRTVIGNSAVCIHGQVMDGIKAAGGYADDISIHCSDLEAGYDVAERTCRWTNPFSEESNCVEGSAGYCDFGQQFAVGVKCTGSYCDNLSFFVCDVEEVQ